MAIIGFNFTSINAEKKGSAAGKISISNNVSIKDIQKAELSLGSEKQKAVKFMFEFISKYDPKIGNITLGGEVLSLEDAKNADKIIHEWEKEKKIEKDVMTSVLNNVLVKCNVQALILSQEVNLPSPIPMPRVKVEEVEANQEEPKKK